MPVLQYIDQVILQYIDACCSHTSSRYDIVFDIFEWGKVRVSPFNRLCDAKSPRCPPIHGSNTAQSRGCWCENLLEN